jgi:hypothetical protein
MFFFFPVADERLCKLSLHFLISACRSILKRNASNAFVLAAGFGFCRVDSWLAARHLRPYAFYGSDARTILGNSGSENKRDLTRIIHEASTAAADPGMSTSLRSVGLLDILSSMSAGPSVALAEMRQMRLVSMTVCAASLRTFMNNPG